MSRYSPLAAAAIVLAVALPFILPQTRIGGGGPGSPAVSLMREARADSNIVMCPEGGRLEAFDDRGLALGPCALNHTDVNAEISGRFARITVKQKYTNPNPDKIEAVYTFPLSNRAAVDRMRMVIGDRVIDAEVREREEARRIYQAARDQGRIASLLEQERPNIFTQSVANIEPRAEIDIEISYVELLEPREGEFTFDFPTVVGPRYIPGGHRALPVIQHGAADPDAPGAEPAAPTYQPRRGLVLLAPATLKDVEPAPAAHARALSLRDLEAAAPIDPPADPGAPESTFLIAYADGSAERGRFYSGNCGEIGGRWFHVQPGAPFASPTRAVPDADRITPMPVKPPTRAGHEISIRVTIDTGGPGITGIEAPLHKVTRTDLDRRNDGVPRRISVALDRAADIPNRDFVLSWRQTADTITESVLTNTGPRGGFFAVTLEPPARVQPDQAVPRELIFVIDTSGSMRGAPMDTCKRLIDRALDGMRPADTFNLITFSGDTRILWNRPRPNSPEARGEARGFLSGHAGAGGTEMMTAIHAALGADGRVRDDKGAPPPLRIVMFLTDAFVGNDFQIIDAIQKNRATTRVFPLGIGNSVNKFLIDSMAAAGGGEPEYVYLAQQTSEADLDAAITRFNTRTLTPVLTDITYTFNGPIAPIDVLPPADNVPDVFDRTPLTILGRYNGSGAGSITIRGRTAQGPWERTIPLVLPERAAEHTVLPTLWARRKIDRLMSGGLLRIQQGHPDPEIRRQIVQLGESFSVLSQYTSFVAVDRLRITLDGKPRLVRIPIELPDQVSWEGNFGWQGKKRAKDDRAAGLGGNEALGKMVMSADTGSRRVDETVYFAAAHVPDRAMSVSPAAAPAGGSPMYRQAAAAPPPSSLPVAARGRSVPQSVNDQVRSLEGARARLLADMKVTDLKEGMTTEDVKTLRLNESLVGVIRDLSTTTSQLGKYEQQLGEGAVINYPEEMRAEAKRDPAVGQMEQDLATLRTDERATLQEGHGPEHPSVIALRKRIEAKQQELADAEQRALRKMFDAEIDRLRTQRTALEAQQTELLDDLTATSIQKEEMTRARVRLDQIDRDLARLAQEGSDVAAPVQPEKYEAQRRADRIHRVLAPDLLGLTAHPTDALASIRITILLCDTSDDTLKLLKAAGLVIDATSAQANVVIGTAPIASLEALAAIDCVKRIEKFEEME